MSAHQVEPIRRQHVDMLGRGDRDESKRASSKEIKRTGLRGFGSLFGQVSTGGGNDLKRATQLVRRMVCEWGMSDVLGPATFGGTEPHPFLGRQLTESKEYSEQTARIIDEQVQQLLQGILLPRIYD